MHLVQTLPQGALDIVGDIHGEYDVLCDLLKHLGYDHDGNHPAQRRLVFVGDLCDRGPDSPAVIAWVQHLISRGNAFAVLGNHEINLLKKEAKEGAGWFFESRHHHDQEKFAPFRRIEETQKDQLIDFLMSLPLALERNDLRIVHAAWDQVAIEQIRTIQCSDLLQQYEQSENDTHGQVKALAAAVAQEKTDWPHSLHDKAHQPPRLSAHAKVDAIKQNNNPIRKLTSGIERATSTPFYASGKWRFAERVTWWDEYEQSIPVIVGHYWRQFRSTSTPQQTGQLRQAVGKAGPDLFDQLAHNAWHGKNKNVFCVDFSVGGRWAHRKKQAEAQNTAQQTVQNPSMQEHPQHYKLAALRWPERTLCFDDGTKLETTGFMI